MKSMFAFRRGSPRDFWSRAPDVGRAIFTVIVGLTTLGRRRDALAGWYL
jgi:hypothetical protein